MEKILFFCVFLYRILQITSSDVSGHNVTLLRFQLNGNISLKCNMIPSLDIITWYHQDPDSGQLKKILMSVNGDMWESHQIDRQRQRLIAMDKVSLVITDLKESDSGLYFCGRSFRHSVTHFDKPIRLQLEDKLTGREDSVHSVTEPPEDVEITDGVTVTERVVIFSGVGLAVFLFFLTTVVTGGIIHYNGWRKGWAAAKRAGLTDQKSAK
ncbi:uncharacterized protein LOC125276019 [Megalobrama amblycephala]|uniref:uncharacterized protein LOC125276019 n=1 Tax=Megalobrama amblycephala TaxID=75352 RepID=UPI002014019D|nr:uncharacterized protein LOC125276019 [Megalobrama amblycephala]